MLHITRIKSVLDDVTATRTHKLQPQSVHTSTSHNRSPIQSCAQSPSVDTPTTLRPTEHLRAAAAIRPHENQSQPVTNSHSCTIAISRHTNHNAAHGTLTSCNRNPSIRAPVTTSRQFRFIHNRHQSTHQTHCGPLKTHPLQPKSVHTSTSHNRRRIRFAHNRRQSTHQPHCGQRNTYKLQPQSVHTSTSHNRSPIQIHAQSPSVDKPTTLRPAHQLPTAAAIRPHEHQSQPVANSDSRTITVSRQTNHTAANGTLTSCSRNPSTRAPVTTGRQFRFAHNHRQSTNQPHCGQRNTYALQPQSVHTSTSHNRPPIQIPAQSRSVDKPTTQRPTKHLPTASVHTRTSRNQSPIQIHAQSSSVDTPTTLRPTEHLPTAAAIRPHEHQSQPVANSDSRTSAVSRQTNHTAANGTLTSCSRNPSTREPVTTGHQFRFMHNRRQSTHQPHCDPRNTYALQPQSVHTRTSHNQSPIQIHAHRRQSTTLRPTEQGALTYCSRNPSTRARVTTGRQFRFAHNHRQSTHQPHSDPRNTYELQPQSVHTSTSHKRSPFQIHAKAISRHTNHTAAHGTLTSCSRNPSTSTSQNRSPIQIQAKAISRHTNHTAAHGTLTRCSRNPSTRAPATTGRQFRIMHSRH
jgi:hypothetical protein